MKMPTTKAPKGPPPVRPKQMSKTALMPGMKAPVGGNPYDRSQSQYSKAPPQTDGESLYGEAE